MKRPHPMPRLLCLLLATLSATAPLHAQSVGEAEAQKCEEKIATVRRDVLAKYDDALLELQTAFQKAADLESALAARAERQRLAAEHTLTDRHLAAEPKALRALQQQTLQRMLDLTTQLVQETLPRLVEFKKSLTVAGKLDEAIAVRTAIEKLQNVHVPLVKPDAGTVVPAETILTAYSADRARADKTYKGQKLAIRGIVGGFRPDAADAKVWLVYLTGPSGGGWVQCTFASDVRVREEKAAFGATVLLLSDKNDTARLQKGQTVEVHGMCEGFEETVRLTRCEVPK